MGVGVTMLLVCQCCECANVVSVLMLLVCRCCVCATSHSHIYSPPLNRDQFFAKFQAFVASATEYFMTKSASFSQEEVEQCVYCGAKEEGEEEKEEEEEE